MKWFERSGAKALLLDYKAFARRRLPAAFGLMLAGAFAEGFGVLMLVPLIASATDLQAIPAALQFVLQPLQRLAPEQRFVVAIALFVGAMIARSFLLYVRDLYLARLQAEYEASLQVRSATTLAALPWRTASRIGQAGMQSLLLNEVPRAAFGVSRAQAAAVSVVLLTVQFAIASLLSPEMAALALAIVVAGLLAARGWTARGLRSGVALSQSYEESSAVGFRVHAGLKAALAQGTVPQFLDEYRASLDRLTGQVVQFAGDQSRARALSAAGAAMAAAVLLIVGQQLFRLELPVLIAILVLFSRMAGPAQVLQQSIQALASYAPAFEAIQKRLGVLQSHLPVHRSYAPIEWQELRVEQVRYQHQDGLGVAEASFSLQAGQWIGITGPSGAGKTTLIDLVAGLAMPQSGSVLVDGKLLEGEVLERWRRSIAYVGQGDTIFDDTVRANLLADIANADDSKLWEALDAVELGSRIRSLAGGLDEDVGDRGSNLSGGERQRLALARALLRQPSLLILDEATSALDANTERVVARRLRTLGSRLAVIVIAHHSRLTEYCDITTTMQENRLRVV